MAEVDHPPETLRIEVTIDGGVTAPLGRAAMIRSARQAAAHRHYQSGEIGIRVTNDRAIHQINLRHLGHDYPTDVISFGYHARHGRVEGELVVSAEMARRRAARLGWPAASELTLYVVHGTLHLTGMDDIDAAGRAQMRAAEHEIMAQLGLPDIARFGADMVDGETADGSRGDAAVEDLR